MDVPMCVRFCSAVPDTTYDRQAAVITATFNYPEFEKDPACFGALPETFLDYDSDYSHGDLHLTMDAQSLVIAMAVNLGYLHLEVLEFASRIDVKVDIPIPKSKRNATYIMNGYYDLRYTSMTPILCMQNATEVPLPYPTELCALVLSGAERKHVGLPLLTHGGVNTGSKIYPCNCSQGVGQSLPSECNEFNFLSGFIVLNQNTTSTELQSSDFLQMLMHLITAYGSYEDFNDAMAPALLLAEGVITHVANPDLGEVLNVLSPCSMNYTTADNPFQSSGMFYCSLVMFQSWDRMDQRVSENNYQLRNGSCKDSFTIPLKSWLDLITAS